MFQVRELRIIENKKITWDMYIMKVQGDFQVRPGQFFMLKAKNADMTLYRPLSIFDRGEDSVSFLYSVRGKGTHIFSELRDDDQILIHGPYGNGFPEPQGKLLLIGGGIGMAPLHLTAKQNKGSKLVVGLREDLYKEEELANIRELFSDIETEFVIGGFVTDAVHYAEFDTVFTCGPEIMMEIVTTNHSHTYVSLEKHMGCGMGACLSCSCKAGGVMKRVCKDGPVFLGKEVF